MRVLKHALLVLILGALAGLPQTARAEPLKPEHVPPSAKWVLHVDFDAFHKTSLAERIRKNRPQMVEFVQKRMSTQFGIDLPQDLHGLTMLNDSYRSHTGAGVLFADYDVEKVRAKLEKKPGVAKTTWENRVLYTCEQDSAAGKQRAMTVLLDPHQLVFGSSVEEVQMLFNRLAGKAIAVDAKTSPLVAEIPAGAVFYGAAIDLDQIDQHEHFFPILRQHERIVYAVGEDNGQVFENATLLAQSEETAKRMEQALVGFMGLYRVWAQGDDALTKLADKVEIRRDAKMLTSRFRAETDVTFAGLQAAFDRFMGEKPANTAKRDGVDVK